MMLLARIGAPIVALLTGSTNLVLRIFGIKGDAEPHLTEDEIRAVISQGAESGALEENEESLVQRVFRVGDQRVGAIMTPRLDIEWVDVDATGDDLRTFLSGHSHGQFVVCQGGLDNVLGTVRAADLLSMAMKDAPITLRSLIQGSAVRARLDGRLQAARGAQDVRTAIWPSCSTSSAPSRGSSR